ncbi:unnamed protein product [[Actinomadura] parvosata subsp. kistnae]|uniref:Lipoprotein n=1 Tax=[Actinomadura] parvosata subsp. kistnae TaxID=1909395 RepID=A0A1V0AGK8_9ACTN|nr:hypothetical protein BKM31_54105 [Nonomuraea sp. ATCC 55076]SPL92166.1 unnamed protein product [Actinomadura parvosata subsp. kistnae]
MRTAIVALAALGLIIAGCSAGADPQETGGKGTGAADGQAKAVKFAECMRSNGLKDFPDPVDGQFNTNFRRGTVLDPNSPQWKAALDKCKDLQPAGFLGGGGQMSPEQQQKMIKYAECMRKNGVPDFPDPEGGALLSGNVDQNSPEYRAAAEACRQLNPGGLIGGQ